MPMRAEIPYGAYWSTPFARWQGSLAHLHSVEFAAHVVARELARRAHRTGAHRLRRARTLGAAEARVLRPALAGRHERRAAGRRPDGDAGLRHRRARAAGDRAGNRGRHGRGRARSHLRPHLQRPAPLLPESAGPGGTGDARGLGDGQLRLRSAGSRTRCCTPPRTWRPNTASPPPSSTRSCCGAKSSTAMALADDSAFLRRFMTLPFEVPDARISARR